MLGSKVLKHICVHLTSIYVYNCKEKDINLGEMNSTEAHIINIGLS